MKSTTGISPRELEIQQLITRYEQSRPEGPVPAWVLPPTSCEFLRDLAASFPSPLHAFEFGSGRSTHALRSGSARTTSVENSADWLHQTEEGGGDKRPGDESLVIPLRRCWNRLRLIESFDLQSQPQVIQSLRESHLILVDSPPNPAKREHALFLALRYAPVGAVIVLDDLEVPVVTRFSLRLARQNSRALRFWKVHIDHQLGLFLKMRSECIRSLPTPREFIGTWLRA